MKGEVVGINSLIYSRTGGYMGLAFAIPIDVAMNTVAQLKEKGRVTRGRIGVQIQAVSKEEAEAFGLGAPRGALVNGVEKDGPAAKAGVEVGDIIVKADGKDVRSSNELPRIITAVRPGTKITVTVWRKGAQKELDHHRRRDEGRPGRGAAAARAVPQPKEKAKPNKMGLVLSDLTDEQKKEADVKTGVVVDDVAPTVRGNVQPGDVILAIVRGGATTEAQLRGAGERRARQGGEGRVGHAADEARRAAVLRDRARAERRVDAAACACAPREGGVTMLY